MTGTDRFKLVSSYAPTGDQPEAIEALTRGVLAGDREQSLVGVHDGEYHRKLQPSDAGARAQ